MNIIEVSHLVKEYKKVKKERGLRGAVKNLFVQNTETVRAVDDISFSKIGRASCRERVSRR